MLLSDSYRQRVWGFAFAMGSHLADVSRQSVGQRIERFIIENDS